MDRFFSSIRAYVPGCSDPWIERAVLNSAIRFCVRSRIWQQESEHSLAAGDQAITLTIPEDSAVDSVQVSDPFFDRRDYSLAGGVITFDDSFSGPIDITVVAVLKPDREAMELPDILYDHWYEGIEAGAKSELMRMPKKPWTTVELSALEQKQYLHFVGEATIRANKQHSISELVVKSRRFL